MVRVNIGVRIFSSAFLLFFHISSILVLLPAPRKFQSQSTGNDHESVFSHFAAIFLSASEIFVPMKERTTCVFTPTAIAA